MKEADVEIVLQRARERFPDAAPRIISDNGPQFIARDFKEFIRVSGMTHVRTSPFYPQSNGKQERWHATLKRDCIRPGTPLDLADARRIVGEFVAYYNDVRLHSAIGYVTPIDKLEGRAEAILAERDRKLQAARERRATTRRSTNEKSLTNRREEPTIPMVGETEAGHAGERPARPACRSLGAGRDSRPGRRMTVEGESPDFPALILSPLMPHKTPGPGGGAPGHRDRADSGWSGVAYQQEAFVQFTLNQDTGIAHVTVVQQITETDRRHDQCTRIGIGRARETIRRRVRVYDLACVDGAVM